MKETNESSFVKNCVLAVVIAVTAAIGLISMPLLASATTATAVEVVEE